MTQNFLKTPLELSGKRIWVAGHSGLVGSALMRALAKEECAVLSVPHSELDLRRQADVEAWMRDYKPDMIIIAAAKVGGIGANATYPAEFLYDNLMIEANIIHAACQNKVEKLLCLGSSCIYPKFAEQPIREDALLTSALEPTNEPYAIAKIAGLKLCEAYRRQYSCDFISAMPCSLYGPGDTYHAENSHVIPAMLMKVHKAKEENARQVTLWGTGSPLREFLHVDDLAAGLVYLLKTYTGAQHINIGSGQEVSIKELAETISKIVGYQGNIVFDSTKPDGTPRKVMDNTEIVNSGWKPVISLEEGVKNAYQDYLERYELKYAA